MYAYKYDWVCVHMCIFIFLIKSSALAFIWACVCVCEEVDTKQIALDDEMFSGIHDLIIIWLQMTIFLETMRLFYIFSTCKLLIKIDKTINLSAEDKIRFCSYLSILNLI